MIIAIICALLFFGNVFRPGWMLPVLGLGLLILSAILIGGIWPAIVQRFQVKPSEPDKEAPVHRAQHRGDPCGVRRRRRVRPSQLLRATTSSDDRRAAAGEGRCAAGRPADRPASSSRRRSSSCSSSVASTRCRTCSTSTATRSATRVAPQDVVIAARELNLDGLRSDQRNWTNDHTVYTHGYGVVAAYGDRRGANGEPVWAQQNLPLGGRARRRSSSEIYFGESEPDYSIVGAPVGDDAGRAQHPASSDTGESGPDLDVPGHGRRRRSDRRSTSCCTRRSSGTRRSCCRAGSTRESKIIYDRDPRDDGQEGRAVARPSTATPTRPSSTAGWSGSSTATRRRPTTRCRTTLDLSEATSDSLTPENGGRRPAVRQDQLHPQLRQGDGRRVRRHGARSTSGTRHGPDPEDLDEGLPRHRRSRRPTSPPTCSRTCAIPRTSSRCSARCWRVPRDQTPLTFYERLGELGGAGGPDRARRRPSSRRTT